MCGGWESNIKCQNGEHRSEMGSQQFYEVPQCEWDVAASENHLLGRLGYTEKWCGSTGKEGSREEMKESLRT